MWALIFFAIQVGLSILSSLLGKKPKPEKKPDIPETSGDAPIQVPFGTCLIPGGELLDYFDYKAVPIKVRSIATLWLVPITVGYRYYLGIVWALCWGKTPQGGTANGGLRLLEILIDGRSVATPLEIEDGSGIIVSEIGALNHQTPGYIYKPNFFGNEKQEGGIVTRFVFYTGMDFYDGGLLEHLTRDAYWQQEATKRDATVKLPHYKDLAYLVWYGPSSANIDIFHGGTLTAGKLSGYIGNSNRLWPVAFKVKRIPICLGGGPVEAGLGTQPTISGEHANPISCLYESFINTEWGLGMSEDELDGPSFQGAAFTCWQEGLGWSYLWTNAAPVFELQQEILTFANGTVYSDRQTGKIVCKLSREDYNVDDLEHLTNDDFQEIEEFSRPGWAETKNEVRLTFTDQSKPQFPSETAYWQELANKQQRGETVAEEITYAGSPGMDQALRLAAREGRVFSTPLAQLTATVDRKCWRYHRGKVFVFDWPEEGIEGMVMRVTNVRYGTIQNPAMRIQAVEDIFKVGEATFGEGQQTVWTDPLEADVEQAEVLPGEVPYFLQKDSLVRVFELAERPNSAHQSYDGAADDNVDLVALDFAPTGLLSSEYPQLTAVYDETETLILNNVIDPDAIEAATAAQIASEGRALAIIGDPAADTHELIAFESAVYDDDLEILTLNKVWRGLLDTTPQTHAANTKVWFLMPFAAIFARPFTTGETVTLKALTRTALTSMRVDQATGHDLVTAGRANRPLPPAYVKLGGDYLDEEQETGDLVFTWLERNRLTQTTVLKQSDATVTPESGVEYEVDVYDEDDVFSHTVTGIASATWTYTNAQEVTDFGELQSKLTLLFWSMRDGLRSTEPFIRRVFRVDPGSFDNGDWILPPQGFDFVRASVDETGWDELGVEVYWT